MKNKFENISSNIAIFLCNLMIFLPIVIVVMNYFQDNVMSNQFRLFVLNIWNNLIRIIGFIGIINFAIYYLISSKEKKKNKIKNNNIICSLENESYLNKIKDLTNYTNSSNFTRILTNKNTIILIYISVLLIAFISTIKSSNFSLSFFGDKYTNHGFLSFLIYGGFFLNSILIPKQKYKNLAFNFIYICAFLCILTTCNNLYAAKTLTYTKDPYSAVFFHCNHFGYYLSIASIISLFKVMLEKSKKILINIINYAIYTIIVYTLILNNTFGSFLAFCITLGLIIIYCLSLKKYRKKIFILTSIFLICICIAEVFQNRVVSRNFIQTKNDIEIISNATTKEEVEDVGTHRGRLWIGAFNMIKQSPLLGYGPDNLLDQYLKMNIQEGSPHNSILQMCATIGIIGGFLMMSTYFIYSYNIVKNIKSLDIVTIAIFFSFISYSISQLTGVEFLYINSYMYILIGLLYKELYKNTLLL